ncbi:MAG TPA: efflux RND transporter periplasmic adaptor subunit [Blastocatellia bacterium]|nr:efflux RND transporter periplasmic adaptor subunit [Blastocatellia bacterium]
MKQDSDSIEHTHRRFGSSPARLLLASALALVLVALVAYLLWPRQEKAKVAVETPPTLEAAREGDEHDEHSQEGAVEVSDETAELVGIKTERVVSGEIEDTIATVGKALVAPNGQAIVGAKVDGRAVRVLAEPGQNVRAGQVLVVVDSPQIAELRGQLIEAQARLRLAEQNLARTNKSENRAAVIQAKNKLDFAQNNLERKQRLAKLGAAAGREVAEAEVEFKNAKAEYDYVSNIQVTREQQQALSEVEQSRAVAARIVQSLTALGAGAGGRGGEVSITSPIAGAVIDRHVSLGQAITQGGEMMTVMNLSSVIIEAQLPESQATRAQPGQPMFARLPGLPDQLFEGRVESVGKKVDHEKRTVPVRARITNAGATLKHEMAVEVRIVTGVRKEGLLVPVSALVEDEGIKVVYVKEGERYERRPVKVGTINYQVAEILSGIKEGEEVVTAGAYQLKNMQKGVSEEGGHHDDH